MKPKVVVCILAVLVLIVGLYIVIKLIEFCEQHFPKIDDPPANATNVIQTGYFVIGAAPQVEAGSVSRAQPAPVTSCDCGCNFTLRIGITNGVPIILRARNPDTIGAAQFMEQFAAMGFNEYQSSNNAPGVIGYAGGVVTVQGDGMVNVTIESSPDLRDWSEVFSTAFPASMNVDLTVPASCTNGFFRIKAQ